MQLVCASEIRTVMERSLYLYTAIYNFRHNIDKKWYFARMQHTAVHTLTHTHTHMHTHMHMHMYKHTNAHTQNSYSYT
jgi:hypothetical protein